MGLILAIAPATVRAEHSPDHNADPAKSDDLMELLEYLGDEQTASDAWNEFLDSVPLRTAAGVDVSAPVKGEEAQR
ncbi:MAG: hypothetical protein R3F24_01475 [Gammaproteobacteria bacterium]